MFKFTLFIALFILTQRLCHRATDGFTPSKIESNLSFNRKFEIQPLDPQQETTIRSLLSGPFIYLDRGAQAYVFASADGQVVLKFFRHHRTRTLLAPLLRFLPSPFKKRLAESLEKRKERREKDFQSYKLAYDHLPKETGLIYLHLNKSEDLKIKLSLYDKIGVHHLIDLDKMEFIVQKRAILLYPALEAMIQGGKEAEAKEVLSQLVQLLKKRCQEGLFDKDPDIRTNFGLLEGHPIQIDGGRFREDPRCKDPAIYEEEIIRITDRLSKWLEKRSPELALHLQDLTIKT
jgi:hypothetical protein